MRLSFMLAGILEGSAALKPNFAHTVLRAVCRRAMTKMEGLNDFNSERCLRPSSRRSQTESYAMLMKLTYTARRRALHVKAHPICSIPHTPPHCRLSAGLCRTAAGSRKQGCHQVCATQMSPALGSDAFQLWVVPSPSCQGRLLRIHVASWSCWSHIV